VALAKLEPGTYWIESGALAVNATKGERFGTGRDVLWSNELPNSPTPQKWFKYRLTLGLQRPLDPIRATIVRSSLHHKTQQIDAAVKLRQPFAIDSTFN